FLNPGERAADGCDRQFLEFSKDILFGLVNRHARREEDFGQLGATSRQSKNAQLDVGKISDALDLQPLPLSGSHRTQAAADPVSFLRPTVRQLPRIAMEAVPQAMQR